MNSLLRKLFFLQLLLFFPSAAFIVSSFFSGEDILHESFIRSEVSAFIDNYRVDPNTRLPQGHTISSFIGKAGIPSKYQPYINKLEPGVHELNLEGLADFSGEQETRIMVAEIRPNEPYFYFISNVGDFKGERVLLNNMFISILAYLIISSFFILTLARFLKHKISYPLASIRKTITSIKETDPTTDLSHITPDGEIGLLAEAIEEKNKRIATVLEREKNTMRNISHELRTPITVLKSSITLVKMNQIDNQYYLLAPEMLNKLERSTRDLESITNAFLYLGHEDSPDIDEETNAATTLQQVIDDYQYLIKHKKINLVVNVEPTTTIRCQPSVYYIAIANLIRNAFTFTEQGDITIISTENSFSIKDSGPGIDPILAETLTKAGVKSSTSQGFGMGLHIVDRVCERMNWRLEIEHGNKQTGLQASIQFHNVTQ